MRHPRWLSLLLLLFTLPAHAQTVDKMPAPTAYVDDYANVIHGLQQSQMEAICTELHNRTKAQIFVVTVVTTGNSSVEEFANQLFHNWKIGEKKTDRGALILIAVHDHKYRIEVGYGLEGILNDAKVGDIGRAMVPDLRSANYDAAAITSLRAVAQTIADDSQITLDSLQQSAPTPPPSPAPAGSNPTDPTIPTWLFWCIWIGIFVLVIVVIIIAKLRGWQSSSSSTFWTSGSSSDSTSSSSDSGSSFGGGDGGDSGGGGASGSW